MPFGDSTALITLNARESNPRIGQGLGTFLQLPMVASFAECAGLAAWLNRKEAAGEFLSHCIGAVMKLRQVNALLNPGTPEPIAWQVVAERLGIRPPPVEAGGEGRAATVQ